MDAFLGLSADDQRAACEEAATRIRLPAVSIEKDFWVCWTLRELFALPEIGPHLTFKGGTSLSKAWQLIERFSEDIDVVIDRDFLGFGGEHSPERAPSRKKQRQWLDELKAGEPGAHPGVPATRARSAHRREAASRRRMASRCRRRRPGRADAAFRVSHRSARRATSLRREDRARRALRHRPADTPEIEPYLAEAFPDLLAPSRFSVRVVAARADLLGEGCCCTRRPIGRRTSGAASPHVAPLLRSVQPDPPRRRGRGRWPTKALFERVAAHREVFFRYTWMRLGTLQPGSLRLLPEDRQREAWERDYAAMRDIDVLRRDAGVRRDSGVVGEFEQRFNAGAGSEAARMNKAARRHVLRRVNPDWARLPLFDRKGWKRVRFGDVVENVNETERDPEAAGIDRFIGLEHMEPGSLHVRALGQRGATVRHSPDAAAPGQVLFGKRRAYQRKVAVAEFDAVVSGDIYVLASKNDRLLPELLPFICMSERFFQHAVGTSAGSLSPRTNWTSLASFEFDLPPLDQQERITEILWTIEEVMISVQPISCIGRKAPRVRLTTSSGRQDTAHSSSNHLKLGELCTLQSGFPSQEQRYSQKLEIGYCAAQMSGAATLCGMRGARSIFRRGEDTSLRRTSSNPGDIVIAMDRPFLSGGGSRSPRVSEKDLPALLLQRVGRFQPRSELLPQFCGYS